MSHVGAALYLLISLALIVTSLIVATPPAVLP